MEEMASLWSYQESVDEMRQKLLCTTLEFEQFKAEASEEIRKKSEYVKQLIQLLKTTFHERDEARDQLQKLLNQFMPSTTFPQLQAESPLLKATMANSSITESNSLSETYNNCYNSHGSSPVDSFFDAVSSPEFSNINQPLLQDCNGRGTKNLVTVEAPKIGRASLIIENLVKGKPLPQKGKLLQAVLDTPPLLQSLLLAGPLPKWTNPPKLQPFQIPPFSIKSSDAETLSQKQPSANLSHEGASRSLNSQASFQMSCGSSQMLSAPLFGFPPSGSCLGTDRLISAGANFNNYVSLSKRQRLQ